MQAIKAMADMIEKTYQQQDPDIYGCIEDMAKWPGRADDMLQNIDTLLNRDPYAKHIDDANEKRRGETVLHAAIKCFQFTGKVEQNAVELLISKFPKLVLQDRSNTEYAGQSPLHMSICKGNIWLVKTLLKTLSKHQWKEKLLKSRASGSMFNNTVMMGELPLSIAALTFNKDIFKLLLEEGARLDGTNIIEDNVCHSLIRYGYLYPDKQDNVMDMCRNIKDINDANRKLSKKVWLMENRECLNPLQLAASLGLHQVFTFILDQEAYCSVNSKDGLFDIKIYDVTEIDAISSMKLSQITGVNVNLQQASTPVNISQRKATTNVEPLRQSILMMLLSLEPAVAFQFILDPPIRRVISQKWNAYRKYFYPWWILHSIFMVLLTLYSVKRSEQNPNTPTGYDVNSAPNFTNKIEKVNLVTAYGIICIVVSMIYIVQEIVRMIKGHMDWSLISFMNPYGNGWFRGMFVLLGLCLIIDFGFALSITNYENYLLVPAMILGWFLTMFFIRAMKPFSFFTVLIQKIVIGDMFRFFVILSIEIIAFATAMQITIQGSVAVMDTNYSNIWRVIFSMFKLMVGVGDLAELYKTRHPGLCIVIFIGFIIMTSLLMVNALIAMMSTTCTELVENVGNIRTSDCHSKLQKLSVILFLESILPNKCIFKVGTEEEVVRYSNSLDRRKPMTRYMLEVRSIQNVKEDADNTISTRWGFRTAAFSAFSNHSGTSNERPFSGLNDNKKRKDSKKEGNDSSVHNQNTELDKQSRVQVQHPQTYSKPTLDIYHISQCSNCYNDEVEHHV